MTSRLVIVGLFCDIIFSFLFNLIDAIPITFIITIVWAGFKMGTEKPHLEYMKHNGDTMLPIYEEKTACNILPKERGPLLDFNK